MATSAFFARIQLQSRTVFHIVFVIVQVNPGCAEQSGMMKQQCQLPGCGRITESIGVNIGNAVTFGIGSTDARTPGEVGAQRFRSRESRAFPDQHQGLRDACTISPISSPRATRA